MAEEAKWYVLHTYSGYENTVATTIMKHVDNRNLHDLIHEVTIPMETVTEVTDSGAKTVERKVFPGYVLIKMVMTDESFGTSYAMCVVSLVLSAAATTRAFPSLTRRSQPSAWKSAKLLLATTSMSSRSTKYYGVLPGYRRRN